MDGSDALKPTSISFDCSTTYGRALIAQNLQGFDLVFSAGPYCRSAFHLRRLLNQTEAFPFDWWVTPATSLQRMLHPDYAFHLAASDLHLTEAGLVALNSRDQVLHLHDFKRTEGGLISLDDIDGQLQGINEKYRFLFDRLRSRLREARSCLLIFEGFLHAHSLESYRQRTSSQPLAYPELPHSYASELVSLLRDAFGVTAKLVCFGVGQLAVLQEPDILHITAPVLSSPLDDESEPWQRPWVTYDLFFHMLCAANKAGQLAGSG